MSSERLLFAMTVVLAVVALAAAFVAVKAARRLKVEPSPASTRAIATEIVPGQRHTLEKTEQVAKIVDGRVIVAPTPRQIAEVTMSRPLVRVSVLSHGFAHALRPESRDRIIALMRREFQSRRRQRKRAAKQAGRLEHPTPPRSLDRATVTSEAWLGELPAAMHTASPTGATERGQENS